jgi:hypothetical protein
VLVILRQAFSMNLQGSAVAHIMAGYRSATK